MSESQSAEQSQSKPFVGLLIRIYYLMLGPPAMVIMAIKLFQSRATFSALDIMFLCNLVLMPLAARYDLMWRERTPEEGPDEANQWRTYMLTVTGAGITAYVLSRFVF